MGVYAGPAEYWYNSNEGRTSQSTRMVVQDGLILNLDAGASTSYFGYWSPILSNGANAFDGSLSTAAGLLGGSTGPFTYTFLNPPRISSARMYVTFGATSNQVGATTNIFLVNGIDVTQKVKNANFYLTSGWIDVTSEAVSNWNTFQFQTINGVTNAGIYAIEVNGNVLVGNYSGTTWTDLSGNGNNGTLVNGVGYTADNGGALTFDGVNDYSTLPTNLLKHETGNPFTFSIWFKTSSTGVILGQQDTSTPNTAGGWVPAIYVGSNGLLYTSCFYGSTPSNVSATSSTVNNGSWNNVTVTFSSGSHISYLNGNSYATLAKTQTFYSSTYYYFLGSGRVFLWPSPPASPYFDGNISNIFYYNRALTASEVSQNYNALKGRYTT